MTSTSITRPFRKLACAIAALALAHTVAHAEGKAASGPNKGRLVGTPPDQAEVLIEESGNLRVTFLDADLRATQPGPRGVAAFAQLPSGRVPVDMVPEADSFVSKGPLPSPDGYMIIVQTRSGPDAKWVNARVPYNVAPCAGCGFKEYACTCTDH